MARDTDLAIKIPEGKKVKIFVGPQGDSSSPLIEMALDSELTFSIGGEYSTVVNNDTSPLQSMLSMLVGNINETVGSLISGKNSKLGYQVFTGGKPVVLSLNCSIVAITDAFKDVISKVRLLQTLIVPRENSYGMFTVLPGMDPLEMLFPGYNSDSRNKDDKAKTKWGYIKIGKLSFYEVLFKDMTVNFSQEIDQTGYPISAKVTLDIETAKIATETLINQIYNTDEDGKEISERII